MGQIFCSRGRPLENSRGRPVEFTGRPVKSTGRPLEFSRGRPLEQKIWPIVNYNFINSDSRVPKYSTTTNDPINAGMLF